MGLPKGLKQIKGKSSKKIVIGHTALYKMITDKSKNRPPKGYDKTNKENSIGNDKNTNRKLTLLILLWILDKVIMLIMLYIMR